MNKKEKFETLILSLKACEALLCAIMSEKYGISGESRVETDQQRSYFQTLGRLRYRLLQYEAVTDDLIDCFELDSIEKEINTVYEILDEMMDIFEELTEGIPVSYMKQNKVLRDVIIAHTMN